MCGIYKFAYLYVIRCQVVNMVRQTKQKNQIDATFKSY